MQLSFRNTRNYIRLLFFTVTLLLLPVAALAALTVTPGTITSETQTDVQVTISGLNGGESVRLERYIDANQNGVYDAGDPVLGVKKIIDGIAAPNPNLLSDGDGLTNGEIVVNVNYHALDDFHAPGHYIYRAISLEGTGFAAEAPLIVTASPTAQSYSGTVLVSGTATPIAGAYVGVYVPQLDVELAWTVSDASGNYTVYVPDEFVGMEVYIFALYKGNQYYTDFMNGSGAMPGVVVQNNASTGHNLTLKNDATQTITGVVRDSVTKAPMPGVWIDAEGIDIDLFASAMTDTAGNFTLNVPAGVGNFFLAAWPGGDPQLPPVSYGYIGYGDDLVVEAAGNSSNHVIEYIKNTKLFTGQVRDIDGQPVAGYLVEAMDWNAPMAPSTAAVTDANGNFTLGLIDTGGPWQVQGNYDADNMVNFDYISSGFEVDYNATSQTGNDLIVQKHTVFVEGTALLNDGFPPENEWISARRPNGSWQVGGDAQADGSFMFPLAPGEWVFESYPSNSCIQALFVEEDGTYVAPVNVNVDGADFGACNTDLDGDGVPNGSKIWENQDNCPATENPGQEDSNYDGIGDACDTADSDQDGLADYIEVRLGSMANNQDSDGDGFNDGEEPQPGIVNANIAEFSMLHTTLGDGSQVAQIVFDIGVAENGLNNLTAVITGPNGFSHAVSSSEVSWGSFAKDYPWLDEGVYTLTVADAYGNSVSRADSYSGLAPTPLVDLNSVYYSVQGNGDVTFSWPHVDAAESYFYSLRIATAAGQTVYLSNRSQATSVTVPARYLQDHSLNAYKFRVETNDRDVFDLIFNRSVTNYVPFTAVSGNADGLLYPGIYHRFEGDGIHNIVLTTNVPGQIAGVTLAEITGPGGFSYQFDLSGDYDGFDNSLNRKLLATDPAAPTQTGVYTFHIVIYGLHYYAATTLTPAVEYPAPDNASWQIENYNNGWARFSWADVNYNGLLYYRVLFFDDHGGYYITSRMNRNYVDVDLGALSNVLTAPIYWRVEVHDSSSFQSLRNRRNGEAITLNVPVYAAKPYLTGRFNNRVYGSGSRYLSHFSSVSDFDQVQSLTVTGPSGYNLDLMNNGDEYIGKGYEGYAYKRDQTAVSGLYAYSLMESGGSTTVYDTLTEPLMPANVDFNTVNIDILPTGEAMLSWAPVSHSSPLWYNVLIESLTDTNQDGFADEIATAYNLSLPYAVIDPSTLPAEPLYITIQARDASTGTLENNRSYAVRFAIETPGFDYSTLVDSDGDGWANNIDADDSDPSVYPYSPVVEPSPFAITSPAGGELFTSGDTVTLSWSADEGADNYRVSYFDADGTNHFIAKVTGDTRYDWVVPDVAGLETGKQLRVVSYSGTTMLNLLLQEEGFSIQPVGGAPFGIITPANGATLTSGDTVTLSWTPDTGVDNYRISYFDADGTNHFIAKVTSGTTYSWTVPDVTGLEIGKQLRVVSYVGNTLQNLLLQSESFAIAPAGGVPYGVNYPTNGTSLVGGSTVTLSWTPDPGADRYRLFYIDGTGTAQSIALVGNVTSYPWAVPDVVTLETGLRIRVTSFNGSTQMNQVFQTGIFSILPSSGIEFEVTAPADGDVLTSGETTTISWMPDIGADRYRIFYFDADGTAHDIALVGNVTSYSWTVPDVASQEDGKRIRIKSFAGSTAMNIVWQVGSFSIAPQLL